MTLVIDCSQLCYQASYTMGHLSYEEKRTGVIFGFLMQIFKLSHGFGTNQFVFCWDSRKSYREQFFPKYKQSRRNRELTDEEKVNREMLYKQRGLLWNRIIPEMGFKNSLMHTGLEADDLIAWVVDEIPNCTVVSSDTDLWQLLDRCVIYSPRTRDRRTEQDLIDIWEVDAKQWVRVKELAGCSTDGVPGIKGVGEKKAIDYIMSRLPDGIVKDRIESPKGKEIIERNRKLVKLPYIEDDRQSKLDFNEDFRLDVWTDIFERYGFNYFLKKSKLNVLREEFDLD